MNFSQESSPKERYQELLTQTKLYLAQEYAISDRIFSESETYAYFKTYALKQQQGKSPSVQKTHIPIASPLTPTQAPSSVPMTPKLPPAKNYTDAPTVPVKLPEMPASNMSIENATSKIEPTKAKVISSNKQPVKPNPPNKAVPSIKANTPFTFEPFSPLPPQDFTDLRKIIKEKLPHIRLLDQITDDTEAKNLASLWTQEKKIPQVLILSFDETPKHLAFLANIAKALEIQGISAQVSNGTKLENGNEWQELLKSKELKLVVASSSGFYNLPELQKYYREGTKHGRHYLGNCLLLLLSDMGFYLKEPTLKSSLWGALKELINISAAS